MPGMAIFMYYWIIFELDVTSDTYLWNGDVLYL